MIEQALLILATAGINVVVTLAVLKLELRYHRRDIDRAHRRLDLIGAPAASE